jgi:hypothetical protein
MRRFDLQKVVLGGMVAGIVVLGVACSAEAQGLQGGVRAGFGLPTTTPAWSTPKPPPVVASRQHAVKYTVFIQPGFGRRVFEPSAGSRAESFRAWLVAFGGRGSVTNITKVQVFDRRGGGLNGYWSVSYNVAREIWGKDCNTEAEARYLVNLYASYGMRATFQKHIL